MLTLTKINVKIILEREEKYNMKRKIRTFIEDHILILFMIFVGTLTYIVGLRDRAEAEAFEKENQKIKIEEVNK